LILGRAVRIATTTIVISTALCLSAYGQPSQRRSQPSPFYVFGEYDYYTDSGDLRGGGGGLGWNFSPYLGVQTGAQFLNGSKRDIAHSGMDSHTAATVVYGEAKLSWPLTDNFSLYGSAGLAHGEATAHFTPTNGYPYSYDVSKQATGYRVGVGTEYWFTRHLGLRAAWHQENVGGVGGDLGVGVAFRF